MRGNTRIVVLIALLVFGIGASGASADVADLRYEVVDFSALTGFAETFGRGLALDGTALVATRTADYSSGKSYFYTADYLEQLIGFSNGGTGSMNSTGRAIGWSEFEPGLWDPAVYDDGVITRYELPDDTLAGYTDVISFRGFNVQQHAIVVGGPILEGGGAAESDGVYFLGEDTTFLIGHGNCNHFCTWYSQDRPVAFNDNDQVLFNERDFASNSYAWLYDGRTGERRYLVSGLPSRAEDMNSAGVIVGDLLGNDPDRTDGLTAGPFIYRDGETSNIQPSLDAQAVWRLDDALAINNLDQILARGRIAEGSPKDLLMIDGSQVSRIPLTDLIPVFSSYKIVEFNDRGEILLGAWVNGIEQAFLLKPVPEPAGIGLVILMTPWVLRRRRSAAN